MYIGKNRMLFYGFKNNNLCLMDSVGAYIYPPFHVKLEDVPLSYELRVHSHINEVYSWKNEKGKMGLRSVGGRELIQANYIWCGYLEKNDRTELPAYYGTLTNQYYEIMDSSGTKLFKELNITQLYTAYNNKRDIVAACEVDGKFKFIDFGSLTLKDQYNDTKNHIMDFVNSNHDTLKVDCNGLLH